MTKTNRLATRINDAPVWVVALSLSLGLAALFSFTAEWNDPDVNVDVVAAALPAWSLAQRGTIELTGVGPRQPMDRGRSEWRP